mgnify:CR=1 FL=1
MKVDLKKEGISLVELIISLFILATIFSAILSGFIYSHRYLQRAYSRLNAANIIRRELNNLYLEVRYDTWDSGRLKIGNTNLTLGNFEGDMTVREDENRDYREVNLNVFY